MRNSLSPLLSKNVLVRNLIAWVEILYLEVQKAGFLEFISQVHQFPFSANTHSTRSSKEATR